MPITVGHVKSITIADGTNSNLVRPGDWNSGHNVTVSLANNEVIKYISAGSNSRSSGNVVFDNAGGVSFGMNTDGGITAVVPGVVVERRFKELIQGERMTTVAAMSATQLTRRPMFAPFWMEGTGLEIKTARFIVSLASSSNRSFGGTFSAGLYQQVNSSQMTLIASDSQSFSYTNTTMASAWNGAALLDFTGMSNCTMTAEGRYMMALAMNPVSANITWMPCSLYGADAMPSLSRVLKGNTTEATNATQQLLPWWGVYSATTAGMPDSVGLTQINGGNSASLVDYYAILKEI